MLNPLGGATGALLCLVALAALILSTSEARADVAIHYDSGSPQLRFAVGDLDEALRQTGMGVTHASLSTRAPRADIVILTGAAQAQAAGLPGAAAVLTPAIQREGFRIQRAGTGQGATVGVLAQDETGAMYGVLDLAEQIRMRGGLAGVQEKLANSRFPFRAVKFNLPWSPYRSGPATEIHLDTCRDLEFWRRFLDMMARNRLNVLSLWNLHPFPFMIRPKGYPEACPFSDEEMARWQSFWRALFRMAKERGIATYVVNWNIVVSPEFARAHRVKVENDTSPIVREYTRQCVTQVIDEYPDLTGLGVTLADWMNGMTPAQREDWIRDTFIAGMKAAKRPVEFIHRSVLAGSPAEMRRVLDEAALPHPAWVEVKFNWSHGHSTPRLAITHDYNSGKIDEGFWNPPPANYRIVWMIRNEDFFVLRWGEPGFIRKHIETNGGPYVGGYFVGSEGYIPAVDTSHRPHRHQTWQYVFEKQWLFYLLWGRLLYDPQTPDAVFAGAIEQRYGPGTGSPMLQAYTLASRMPLRLASFHAATWDYTLYSEGFASPVPVRGLNDKASPFISMDELIQHETLDPAYLSIPEYVEHLLSGRPIPPDRVTPAQLADECERDGEAALKLAQALRSRQGGFPGAMECELDDVATWAHLGLYFAEKLRAGVALATFRKTGAETEQTRAVAGLERAARQWEDVSALTERHYRETPHVSGITFSWVGFRDQVARDVEIARQARPAGK